MSKPKDSIVEAARPSFTRADVDKRRVYLAVRISEGLKWLSGERSLGKLAANEREILATQIYKDFVELEVWNGFERKREKGKLS